MELLAWFLLENFYLDEHVRYIVTIYPVVILWLTGTLDNSGAPESHIYIFAAIILAISCIVFAARIALITWKHCKRPLYTDNGPNMSPLEIALTHSNICLHRWLISEPVSNNITATTLVLIKPVHQVLNQVLNGVKYMVPTMVLLLYKLRNSLCATLAVDFLHIFDILPVFGAPVVPNSVCILLAVSGRSPLKKPFNGRKFEI
ncbi:hypothetical protein Q8A73_020505 [Channa argus]|nr:hypothetical protein Q8A73_020505 [Channa argus]